MLEDWSGGAKLPAHGLCKTPREDPGQLAAFCPSSETGPQFWHYFSPKTAKFPPKSHLVFAICVRSWAIAPPCLLRCDRVLQNLFNECLVAFFGPTSPPLRKKHRFVHFCYILTQNGKNRAPFGRPAGRGPAWKSMENQENSRNFKKINRFPSPAEKFRGFSRIFEGFWK